MAWTNVAKPTGTPYTKVTFQGKQAYDDPGITYDESDVFYDSRNVVAWTDVAKPSGITYTTAGMATGLIMPPTYAKKQVAFSPWTNVNKPT